MEMEKKWAQVVTKGDNFIFLTNNIGIRMQCIDHLYTNKRLEKTDYIAGMNRLLTIFTAIARDKDHIEITKH